MFVIFCGISKFVYLLTPRFLVEPIMMFYWIWLGNTGLSLNRRKTNFITYGVNATFQDFRVKLSKICSLLRLFTSRHGVTWKKTWIFIYNMNGVLDLITLQDRFLPFTLFSNCAYRCPWKPVPNSASAVVKGFSSSVWRADKLCGDLMASLPR